MTTDNDDFPTHLTFSQRYGYEPLPEPMRVEEISDNLRREIWFLAKEFILEKRVQSGAVTFSGPPRYRFYQKDSLYFQRVFGKLLNAADPNVSYSAVYGQFEQILLFGKFNEVIDFLEILLNDREKSNGFAAKVSTIEELFEHYAASYWLDTSRQPYRFVPRSSHEQGKTTRQAIEILRESQMNGAAAHLRQAVEHINARQHADSIADSIHAVESVARVIDSEANTTLGPALSSLERAGVLRHTALRQAFEKLYGYTSDEQGIRHALLDKDGADVGPDEALFMFGACASFAAYLTSKHRQSEEGKAGGA